MFGDTLYYHGNRIAIRLNANLRGLHLYDTLIHEWAHALTMTPGQRKYHTEAWGAAYARCYTLWEEFEA